MGGLHAPDSSAGSQLQPSPMTWYTIVSTTIVIAPRARPSSLVGRLDIAHQVVAHWDYYSERRINRTRPHVDPRRFREHHSTTLRYTDDLPSLWLSQCAGTHAIIRNAAPRAQRTSPCEPRKSDRNATTASVPGGPTGSDKRNHACHIRERPTRT
eukprot:2431858-Prymnesium_polylepis.2